MKTIKADKSPIACFKEWLELNQNKFVHPVGIENEEIKDYAVILEGSYEGIIPVIKPTVIQRESGFEIAISVEHKNNFWDYLTDFPVIVESDGSGKYFCGLCAPDKRLFYPSIERLLQKHCFDPFRKWSNKNIAESNFLVLIGSENKGITAARIKRPGQLKKYLAREEPKWISGVYPLGRALITASLKKQLTATLGRELS